MKIRIRNLEKLVRDALSTKYSKNEIDLMLPVVMFGELSGRSSHGIMRVIFGKMSILAREPSNNPVVKKISRNSIVIEGNGNAGMLIGNIACDEVIKLTKRNVIGIVGSRGSIGSSGSLSYYAEKIANEGLVGIIMSRAPADVAPLGGLERIFGTNPIAFGIPTDKKPLIFDMATSAISYGAVMRAKSLGIKLPEGVAIDQCGNITTDPEESIKGAFLPFVNSYKGAGLCMMVEILAGVFTGADFADLGVGDEWGNLFISFKPDIFLDRRTFEKRVRILIEKVRNSKTMDGNKIRISGENTIMTRDENLKTGYVEVDEKLVKGIEGFIKTGEIL